MRLPSKRKRLLRDYSNALFYNPTESKSDRVYIFYLILRPCLSWLYKELVSNGLEKPEAESELYIFCYSIFNNFNKDKSSIVPYIEKAIPWYSSKLLNKYRRTQKELVELEPVETTYELQEEYGLEPIKILFIDKFVGKHFTNSEKYLISIIITLDYDELTKENLSKICRVNRKTMHNKLEELKLAFVDGGY